MEHVLMNTTLAQSSLLPFKFDFVLCGIGVVLLLVLGILAFNLGTIHIRALFSGAKVTINKLLKKPCFEKLTLEIIGGFACFFARK